MTLQSALQVTCSACKASLTAKPEMAGKRAKCPKCGSAVEIPASPRRHSKPGDRPATERQKEYARSLRIAFSENITRSELSKLIDDAVTTLDEERFQRLNELDRRESEAWERVRREVLAEMDAEDPRLSKAEPSQIVEALSERGLAAVLVTMPWGDIHDFGDLRGVNVRMSFSDDMTREDMESTIMACASEFMKRKGII